MTDSDQKTPAPPFTRLRQWFSFGALILALAHLLWPRLSIDGVTLALIAFAVLPWLAPLFKSIELPGGWKVTFQELEKAAAKADSAGLLAAPAAEVPATPAYLSVAKTDPNLALAGLRIELEKRLRALASQRALVSTVSSPSLGQLLRLLAQQGVLTDEERVIIADLTGLLNSAVHGAEVSPDAVRWTMEVGPRLLRGLEERAQERPTTS